MDQEIMDETLMDQEIMDETEQSKPKCRKSLHKSADDLKTHTDWLIDNVNNECRLEELKEYMDEYGAKISGLKQKSSYEDTVLTYLKEVESRLSDLLKENEGSNIKHLVTEFLDWHKGKFEELRKTDLYHQDDRLFCFSPLVDNLSNSLLGNLQKEQANAKEINPTELVAQLREIKEYTNSLRRTHTQTLAKKQEDYWKECIKMWYPNLQTSTYFLPPLHFNKDQLEEITFGQLSAYQIKTAGKDDSERNERAQERVMHRLHELTRKRQDEPMVVISELDFGRYLNKPCYAAAADCYPQLKDIPISEHRQGDFDVLIIHRKHGLIACEIKAVGYEFKPNEFNSKEKVDMRDRIREATLQMNKSEKFLEVIAKDVKVTKSLLLPFVSIKQFRLAVSEEKALKRELCRCFGKEDDYEENVLFKETDIEEWWEQITKIAGQEMSASNYESIVSRFCGPATTVNVFCVSPPHLELRTRGEAVAETGRRFARFTLLPDQVKLIHRHDDPLVYLCGPPGTGKTVVLILKALKWMEEGYVVHLVSTWYKSLPAFYFIEYHLQNNTERSIVRPYVYDLAESENVEKAVEELKLAAAAEGKDKFCVIIDEPGPDLREDAIRMFDKGDVTYEYKTDMKKDKALKTLAEHFSMTENDVLDTLAKNTDEEWMLSVVKLQDFCTNYAIFNRWRQEHAKDIFLEYAQEHLLPLNKDEALRMLQEKYPQVKRSENMFHSNEMGLTQFRDNFVSMHASEVFDEHLKYYKKSLIQTEAVRMLRKEFNLTELNAKSKFDELKDDNGNLSATLNVKQFTDRLTSGNNEAIRVSSKKNKKVDDEQTQLQQWRNTTFQRYVDCYGICLGETEAVVMLEKEYELTRDDANIAFENYNSDRVLDKEGFRTFYTSHPKSSKREEHAQTVFKGIIKEYKKNMSKTEARDMLKNKFKLTDNELEEIEPKMNASNLQWIQKFYSQDLKAETLRRQHAEKIFLRYAPRHVCYHDGNMEMNLAAEVLQYKRITNILFKNVQQGKLSFHMYKEHYLSLKESTMPPKSCLDKLFFLLTSDAAGESQKREDTQEMFQGAFSMSTEDAKYYTDFIFGEKKMLTVTDFLEFYAKYTNACRKNEYAVHLFCPNYFIKLSGESRNCSVLESLGCLYKLCKKKKKDLPTHTKAIKGEAEKREWYYEYVDDSWKKAMTDYALVSTSLNCQSDLTLGTHYGFILKVPEFEVNSLRQEYSRFDDPIETENNFIRFCEDLSQNISELCLWVGAIERHIKPMCMREEKLCVPLRCPPEIVRKVTQSGQIKLKHVHDYVLNTHPLPTFGLPFQKLKHKGADLHRGEQPKDCSHCGTSISDILKQLVDASNSSSYLQYRDVIVVCEDPQDNSELVLALNGNGIPVRVVSRSADESKIKNTSLRRSDKVTVSHYRHVHGLERKVVILAGNNNWKNDYQLLYDMSRCTGLLVLIDPPEFKDESSSA